MKLTGLILTVAFVGAAGSAFAEGCNWGAKASTMASHQQTPMPTAEAQRTAPDSPLILLPTVDGEAETAEG